MKSVLTALDRVLPPVLVVLMVTMVLSVTWQVVSRYLLSAPSAWTEEVARYLLIWIGMLGAAFAFRSQMHIGFDLLPNNLGDIAARRLRLFTALVVIVFALTVLVYGGGSLVLLTWQLGQTSAALGLPIALVYSVIPLAGLIIILYAAAGPGETERAALPQDDD